VVNCAGGAWTYPKTLILDSCTWDIKTDTVVIQGDMATTANTQIHMILNPGATPSALINVATKWSPLGSYTFDLFAAPVGTYVITLVQYLTRDPGAPTASSPTFPPYPFNLCRVPDGKPSLSVENSQLVMNLAIKNHPTFDCVNGRGNRDWVIVLMILVSIHAVFFLLFCLITCKKEDLKEKIWDI